MAKKPICTNQGFKSFIPIDEINSLYLYVAIKKIVPEIQKASHGNIIAEITKELVQNFKIPLPHPRRSDQDCWRTGTQEGRGRKKHDR
ncbi:MAG: hypothetical protein EF813_03310 [Methanosarcinales archaeon]|nr:MAG: hypothetical protein EF813_03310 [Methanosarcinales archaeon]